MIEIDVFCPLYNAEHEIEYISKAIYEQKNVVIRNVLFVLTESTDGTEDYLNNNDIRYVKILKEDFSYSLTREYYIKNSLSSNIVVMISQDIRFVDNLVFYNLAKCINDEIAYSFARQKAYDNSIEKYIREYNYPSASRVVSKSDIDVLGIKAFFASDVCCAIDRGVFLKLNGYDSLNLVMNQDMYYAKKMILNNYKIKYEPAAIILHSHKYKLKSLYKRYVLIGNFFRDFPEFQNYRDYSTAADLAKYVLVNAVKEVNVLVLLRFLPNMMVRYFGKKRGMKNDS